MHYLSRHEGKDMKSVIVLYSYHHNNTAKLAQVFSNELDAPIYTPEKITPELVSEYDLICFGSGIYSDQFHPSMIEFVDKLPSSSGKKTFLFSTAAITSERKRETDHSKIRAKLESKGYDILGEYQCLGFNTNSFLKYLGGMNKGRPNTKDLQEAEVLAGQLKKLD